MVRQKERQMYGVRCWSCDEPATIRKRIPEPKSINADREFPFCGMGCYVDYCIGLIDHKIEMITTFSENLKGTVEFFQRILSEKDKEESADVDPGKRSVDA